MKASERYKLIKTVIPDVGSEEEYIRNQVNSLIASLFIPSKDSSDGIKLDLDRLVKFKIHFDEPVNWHALSCSEVKIFKEVIEIVLDEAAPGECHTLSLYIEDFLLFHGYNAIVRTEW